MLIAFAISIPAPQIEIRKAAGGSSSDVTNLVISATQNLAAVTQPTNNILTQITTGTRPLLEPFAIIDGLPYYPTNPWVCLVDDEFIGDVTSASAGAISSGPWISSAGPAGTQFRRAPITSISNALGYLSIQITNSGGFVQYIMSSSFGNSGIILTNYEIIIVGRMQVSSTNTSGEVRTLRMGFSDTGSLASGEAANGAYIMINTNVNTNNFVLHTSRASASSFLYADTHSANSYSQGMWTTFGLRFNGNTNYFAFVGSTYTNLTTIATNASVVNIPGFNAIMSPYIGFSCIASVGNVNRTNYFDRVKIMGRPLQVNF